MVNKEVADWQDSDGPNKAILGDADNDRRFIGVLRFLAVLLAILVVLGFLRRSWKARYDADRSPVPTDTGRVAASGLPGSFARRREELLQAGNYTVVVREYLRDLFAERGLPDADTDGWRDMPRVTGPDAKRLKNDLNVLWNVAYSSTARPVTFSRWKEIEPMLEAVRESALEGRWQFAIPGGSA